MPSNLLSALGKVFAVRRIRPSKLPPIPTPPSINIACPPQEPGFTSSARTPNVDPSNNDSRSDQMREYGIHALTVTAPIAGSIPVVGSPLKAVVDVLLEILKAADRVNQNKKDMQSLREKLVDLQHYISTIPQTNNPVIRELYDNLANQLNEILTRLESLRVMPLFRYSTVKQTIKQCSKDIDYYLQRFSALTAMYMPILMEQQQIHLAAISRRPTFTGVVLMDATGKRHEMSIGFAGSYKIFAGAIRLLFENDTLEARLQRRYMEEEMYDLAIDGRDAVIAINGQQDWSEVQPGTIIIMRVIMLQNESTDTRKYQCPRCRKWNYGSESSSSIDCQGCEGRFQISNAGLKQVAKYKRYSGGEQEMMLLRNFHLKKYNEEEPTRRREEEENKREEEWKKWMKWMKRRREEIEDLHNSYF